MSQSVENAVAKFGRMVTGQINVAWDTRQTAEQFLEIREQGGLVDDPIEFTIEEFVEYVRSNTSDVVASWAEEGRISLEEEIFLLDEDGKTIED